MAALTDSFITLVLDHRVPYLNGNADASLLTLPLGNGSLLDRLATELDGCGDGQRHLLVAPCFAAGPSYQETIRHSTRQPIRVVPQEEMGALLTEHEATDDVLLVDPRYWPAGGYGLATLRAFFGDYRGVTHGVVVGADPEGTHEWVDQDGAGRVKGVPRFYDRVSWPEVAATRLCMTLVAARLVGPPPVFSSLSELRTLLVSRGMLSRDLALNRDIYDLNDPDALLALNEQALIEGAGMPANGEFKLRSRGVWVGRECQIHPRARLIPPVVIHKGVSVEKGATVLGPCTIGRGSSIGRGAVIARSLVGPNSSVSQRSIVQEQVFCGHGGHHPSHAVTRSNGAAKIEPVWLDGQQGHATGMRVEPTHEASGPRWYHLTSRALNLVLAGLGVVLLAPLGVVIALLIKLDSRGPVFFGHVREGRGGRPFRCLKFRTMSADAHRKQRELYQQNAVDGPQFKLAHDPRVTRVGRCLRSTNLDEIPQLINVLRGEMNLVGPRPSPFRENQICVPWRRARLSVQPGITGLWQICRDRTSDADFHQWIYFDLMYVRNASLWLDLKILAATVITAGGRWAVPMHWLIPFKDDFRAAELCIPS